jgi:hypothetical protein
MDLHAPCVLILFRNLFDIMVFPGVLGRLLEYLIGGLSARLKVTVNPYISAAEHFHCYLLYRVYRDCTSSPDALSGHLFEDSPYRTLLITFTSLQGISREFSCLYSFII